MAEATGWPVIDWDVIYAEVTGLPMHARSRHGHHEAWAETRFRQLVRDASVVVVRAAPERQTRSLFRRLYGAEVLVLEVPAAECLRRLAASGRPGSIQPATAAGIRDWWRRYRPSPRDRVERWP
jgi:hypothetical protein